MLAVLFTVFFVLSAACAVIFCKVPPDPKKRSGIARILISGAAVFTAAAVSMGIVDLFVDFATFNNVFILLGVFNISELILSSFRLKRTTKVIPFTMKAVFWAVILELTLFNMPSYRLLGGNYPQRSFTAEEGTVDVGNAVVEDGKIRISENNELVVAYHDLDFPIGTVNVDLEFPDSKKSASFVLDVQDVTQQGEYRFDIARTRVVPRRSRSNYMNCYLSGNVTDARVKFVVNDNGEAYFKGVTFNKPMPFGISIVRLLVLILGSTFVYSVIWSAAMQKSVSKSRVLCDRAFIIITAGACMIALISVNFRIDGNFSLSFDSGNQVSQELVDAFEAGQTHLLEEPTPELMALDNPYDKWERGTTEGVYFAWDHLLYNGKYYSYYGIMPVLVLFLPYHKITGHYFSTPVAVFIFGLIGILGLSFLFRKIVRKFFPDIPAGCYIACLMLVHIISGIWFSFGRPDFYELAISAGFAFVTWAAYCLFSANIVGTGKIHLGYTFMSSLLFGAAVLSRPTLVLYCLCAALFMVLAVGRASGDEKKKFTKNTVAYIICAVAPMGALGVLQMLYNYDRFGNILEFGIQYSLTINDFTQAQFHGFLSWTALYNFLLNPPVFTSEYPFIHTNSQYLGGGGYFFIDDIATYNTSGLFFLALPMFAYLLSGRVLKSMPNGRSRASSLVYIGLPCVIVPLIIICSVWESGYAVRYMADFAWQMTIGSLAIIFYLYTKTNDEKIKKLIRMFLCFSFLWALVVGGIQEYNQVFRFSIYHYESPQGAYDLEQLIAFWR